MQTSQAFPPSFFQKADRCKHQNLFKIFKFKRKILNFVIMVGFISSLKNRTSESILNSYFQLIVKAIKHHQPFHGALMIISPGYSATWLQCIPGKTWFYLCSSLLNQVMKTSKILQCSNYRLQGERRKYFCLDFSNIFWSFLFRIHPVPSPFLHATSNSRFAQETEIQMPFLYSRGWLFSGFLVWFGVLLFVLFFQWQTAAHQVCFMSSVLRLQG